MLKSILKSSTAHASNYGRATQGNVAMMFSVAVFSMLVCIGAAVDFSSAAAQRSKLQGYADAAVLAAAKSRSEDIEELQRVAQAVFDENNAEGWPVEIVVSLVNDEVVVNATSVYNAQLMGIVGKPELEVSVETASPRAFLRPINLAMVLDTTGSMAGANIAALKTAANGLIDAMSEFENNTNISVVPFGQYVNIESQRGQPWLDIDSDGTTRYWDQTYTQKIVVTQGSCTPTGATRTDNIVVDGVIISTVEVPILDCIPTVYTDGPEVTQTQSYTSTWNGCAGSRSTPYNLRADYGTTRIPGAMNVTCGEEMMPLMDVNDNKSILKAKISNLTAVGGTYLPAGLIWGWRSLSEAAPFPRTVGLGKGRIDAILLMTDGANTMSQLDDKHEGVDAAAGLAQFGKLCKAAKKTGVRIFTVGYRLDGAGPETQQALLDCASDSGSNFTPENAAELASDFRKIVNLLDSTRLSY